MSEMSYRPWSFVVHLVFTAVAMAVVLAVGFVLTLVGVAYLPVDLCWIALFAGVALVYAAVRALELRFERKYG
jgi:hypothetical protein